MAIWYQQTSSGSPSVQIQDTSEGPAREVASADAARFYWWEWSDWLPLIAAFAAGLGALFVFLLERRSVRSIFVNTARLKSQLDLLTRELTEAKANQKKKASPEK